MPTFGIVAGHVLVGMPNHHVDETAPLQTSSSKPLEREYHLRENNFTDFLGFEGFLELIDAVS